MFRITEDPPAGSLVQCLAKITKMVLSCPLAWRWSVLWQHILTRCAQRVRICCHNTDHLHANGHDRTIFVILAKLCTRLPAGGSSVIRNMLEHF
jgi:predicted deacetylase